MTSILIVDDHPVFRAGLRYALETVPGFQVAGEAGHGLEAMELVAVTRPDIVLLDINLPGINGLVLTKLLRESYPQTAIIVVSLYGDESNLIRAIRAGVAAYCTKDMALSEIVLAVCRVADGEVLIDEILAARPALATLLSANGAALLRTKQDRLSLSYREAEILDCIVRGDSNKEIARRLKISEQTVKTHVAAILRQLGANNRTSAAMTAVQRGWVTLDS